MHDMVLALAGASARQLQPRGAPRGRG
eukprot:COSAG02_NODE_52046_length_310_cov_0.943128_2_plen_26_part_01